MAFDYEALVPRVRAVYALADAADRAASEWKAAVTQLSAETPKLGDPDWDRDAYERMLRDAAGDDPEFQSEIDDALKLIDEATERYEHEKGVLKGQLSLPLGND